MPRYAVVLCCVPDDWTVSRLVRMVGPEHAYVYGCKDGIAEAGQEANALLVSFPPLEVRDIRKIDQHDGLIVTIKGPELISAPYLPYTAVREGLDFPCAVISAPAFLKLDGIVPRKGPFEGGAYAEDEYFYSQFPIPEELEKEIEVRLPEWWGEEEREEVDAPVSECFLIYLDLKR